MKNQIKKSSSKMTKKASKHDSSDEEIFDSSEYETVSDTNSNEESESDGHDTSSHSESEQEDATSGSEFKETTTSEDTKDNAKQLEKSLFSLLKKRATKIGKDKSSNKKKSSKRSNSSESSGEDEIVHKKRNTKTNRIKKRTNKESENEEESDDEEDEEESEDEYSEEERKIPKRYNIRKNRKTANLKKNKNKVESESESDDSEYVPKKKMKRTKRKKIEDDEDDEDDDDDVLQNGIILSIDGFGGMDNDEAAYDEMKEQDKNEKCNSDDEETFMKEVYEKKALIPESEKRQKENKKKGAKKSEKEIPVEEQYREFVKLRKEMEEQLKRMPKNPILKKTIKECQKAIHDLVKKERNKNTEEYFQLVYKDAKSKNNTNEMSYFKKKLSRKEQLRVMKDLKEINEFTNIDRPYRLALLETDIPPKFKAIALQKLNILKSMDPNDSEYYKMKNWVDGFMRVPYGNYKNLSVTLNDGIDKCHEFIENARNTLDLCTYGLDDAKMQILQMVGQWITNPSAMGTAIAIKGPPGTGKTTLVKEGISKILGREFAFIALGGTSDASFLEGHSYTYEGSSWGKIVSILMESKCMNPVIYFDELDKISDTPKGEEIASILTHLTDTTQNNQFHDKYYSEVDFDLSKCLFIFSYNDESKINPILKDRMYRILTKGYDAKEKTIIAKKHLLPKIREQINFKEEDVVISDEILQYIIGHPVFCKGEQGVRNLKRSLEVIHTKLNLFRLVKKDQKLFEKHIDLEVSFPFTVEKKHVDILIKSDEPLNPSMLAMYV